MRLTWLLAALLMSALLAAAHSEAMEHFLYWRHVWLDLPMHFLGGATAAAFVIAFRARFAPASLAIAVIAILGGWELFEYALGFPREANYAFDTALDILMGTFGAVAAYIVARFTIWR